MSLFATRYCENCGKQKEPVNICQCKTTFTLSYNTVPLLNEKYYVGAYLTDNDNADVFYRIITIAPNLDYEGKQCYFVEVLDKGNNYYISFTKELLDECTE